MKHYKFNTVEYLREILGINIKINDLCNNDELLYNEVNELLKDNGLWDGYDKDDIARYYKNVKRIYAIKNKKYDFNYIINNLSPDIKTIISSPDESLYRYMYQPAFSEEYYDRMRYEIQLPIECNASCDNPYCYIIILLENDYVIVGRYGTIEFGHHEDTIYCCFYGYSNNDIKQVSFDLLEEPYKGLIIEKILEENQLGLNIDNIIHLLPNEKKNILVKYSNIDEKNNIIKDINDNLKINENNKIKDINCNFKINENNIIKDIDCNFKINKKNYLFKKEEKIMVINNILDNKPYSYSIISVPFRIFSGYMDGWYFHEKKGQIIWKIKYIKRIIENFLKIRFDDNKYSLSINEIKIEGCYLNNPNSNPTVAIYGSIIDYRFSDISDNDILNTLFELFTTLKIEMKKDYVIVNYQCLNEYKSYYIN